jgi:transcriptional antiterminator NusG
MSDTQPTDNKEQITENKEQHESKVEEVKAPEELSPTASPVAPAVEPLKGSWFVIHTYSGHENKAAAALKQRVAAMGLTEKIYEVVVPTRNIVVVKHGKKEEQKEKIFPGYILVRMTLDDESWLAVRTTPGITAFVGMGNKPTPISDSEVEAIMKFMKLDAPKFKTKFTTGEAVKIVDGPFADFLGSIESIDEEKGKVRVLVSIFGRETPVELDFLQIHKL